MRTVIFLFMAGLVGVGAAATYTIIENNNGRVDMSDEMTFEDELDPVQPSAKAPVIEQQNPTLGGEAPETGETGEALAALDKAATPKSVNICPGQPAVPVAADGRLLNHYPYADAGGLVSVPASFSSGNCQVVGGPVLPALNKLLAAAKKENPAVGRALMGVSCHRTIARQKGLFCRPDRIASRGIAGQAKWVAPPGYSEHSTGFAIDFGSKNEPQCHVSPCFKDTATGKWLKANASRFGFELSFPAGNGQGVSFEPWHFRYIEGSEAKAIFAKSHGG